MILMATISSCQGVQELWDRLDWYALATATFHQYRQVFGTLSGMRLDHYSTIYPLVSGGEIPEVIYLRAGASLTPKQNQ